MSCFYCGQIGQHKPGCPELTPTGSIARQIWAEGYTDGLNGLDVQWFHPIYAMGWLEAVQYQEY